jgi:pimeloyl-ACP methyl ester carboxylesterase
MPELNRDGVRIHYEVRGGRAPAVLFTHGFAATSHMFRGNADAVATAQTAITWDMRGHGASDYPADPAAYSVATVIDDMAALLDVAGAEQAVLLGHSLGGYVSLEFCLVHPNRVRGLVLVDTGPGFRRDEPRAAWNAMVERFAVAFDTKGLDGLDRKSAEHVGAQHRDATGLAHVARGILVQHDARVLDGLATLDVPTLVVVGLLDTGFVDGSRHMAAKIPRARLVEIAGAGHAPNLTHAAEFDLALREFLEEL